MDHSAYLEYRDRQTNADRFCEILLSKDLFGHFVLTKISGRAGNVGRERCWSYLTELEALTAGRRLIGCKQRIGYRFVKGDLALCCVSIIHQPDKYKCVKQIVEHCELQDRLDGRWVTDRNSLSLVATLCRLATTSSQIDLRQFSFTLPYADLRWAIAATIMTCSSGLRAVLLGTSQESVLICQRDAISDRRLRSNVHFLVPKPRFRALYRDVMALCAGDKSLENFAIRSIRAGILVAGQLVQLSYEEIMHLCRNNRSLLEKLERRLAACGLALCITVPSWTVPQSIGYSRALAVQRTQLANFLEFNNKTRTVK